MCVNFIFFLEKPNENEKTLKLSRGEAHFDKEFNEHNFLWKILLRSTKSWKKFQMTVNVLGVHSSQRFREGVHVGNTCEKDNGETAVF